MNAFANSNSLCNDLLFCFYELCFLIISESLFFFLFFSFKGQSTRILCACLEGNEVYILTCSLSLVFFFCRVCFENFEISKNLDLHLKLISSGWRFSSNYNLSFCSIVNILIKNTIFWKLKFSFSLNNFFYDFYHKLSVF